MPRTPTTDATRVARTVDRVALLQTATDAAMAAAPADAAAAWTVVATLAGNVQRDSRMLAGLGRGG